MTTAPGSSGAERLRHAIDKGETRDKVRGSDPAAVPLEADAEASGTPTPPSGVRAALQEETARITSPETDVISETQSRNPFAYFYLALMLAVTFAFIIGVSLAA